MRTENLCFGDDRFSPRVVRSLISRRDAFVLVALEEDVIIGAAMCVFSKAQCVGRIASVAVLADRRERGVGTKLLNACERDLRKTGITRFALEVSVANAVAVRMYESSGYSTRSTIQDYYGKGLDAFYMEKDVTMKGRRTKVKLS